MKKYNNCQRLTAHKGYTHKEYQISMRNGGAVANDLRTFTLWEKFKIFISKWLLL